MNLLQLQRLTKDDRPTISVLRHKGRPLSFAVEDRYRKEKVKGDTRIPPGLYPLVWRTTGRWAARFQKMGYPGSLEVCGIPGFTDVLLHIGNSKRDTEGCPLPNLTADFSRRTGGRSADACRVLYDLVHEIEGDWEISVE